MESILVDLHKNALMDLEGIIKTAATPQQQIKAIQQQARKQAQIITARQKAKHWEQRTRQLNEYKRNRGWLQATKDFFSGEPQQGRVDWDYNQRMRYQNLRRQKLQQAKLWDKQQVQGYKNTLNKQTQLAQQEKRQVQQIQDNLWNQAGKGVASGALGAVSDVTSLVGWDGATNAIANARGALRDSAKDKYGIVNDDFFNRAQTGGRSAVQLGSYLAGGAALKAVKAGAKALSATSKAQKAVAAGQAALKAVPGTQKLAPIAQKAVNIGSKVYNKTPGWVKGVGKAVANEALIDANLRGIAKGSEEAANFAYMNRKIQSGQWDSKQAAQWLASQRNSMDLKETVRQFTNPFQIRRYAQGYGLDKAVKFPKSIPGAWNTVKSGFKAAGNYVKNTPAKQQVANFVGNVAAPAVDIGLYPYTAVKNYQNNDKPSVVYSMQDYKKDPTLLLYSPPDPTSKGYLKQQYIQDGKAFNPTNFATRAVNGRDYYTSMHFNQMLKDPSKASRMHSGWFVGNKQRNEDKAGLLQASTDAFLGQVVPERAQEYRQHARQSIGNPGGVSNNRTVKVYAQQALDAQLAKPKEQQDQKKIQNLQLRAILQNNTKNSILGDKPNYLMAALGGAAGNSVDLMQNLGFGKTTSSLAQLTGIGATQKMKDDIQQVMDIGKMQDPDKRRQLITKYLSKENPGQFGASYIGSMNQYSRDRMYGDALKGMSPQMLQSYLKGSRALKDELSQDDNGQFYYLNQALQNPTTGTLKQGLSDKGSQIVMDQMRNQEDFLDPNSKTNQYVKIYGKYKDLLPGAGKAEQEIKQRTWNEVSKNPGRIHDALRLWANSKGWTTAANVLGNPLVTYGLPTLALILGGSALFGGSKDNDDQDQKKVRQPTQAQLMAQRLANS